MIHDPRLIEAVARVLCIGELDAQRALEAIDASGIAWVAPWVPTEAMLEFEAEHIWSMMRDAYLAEQRQGMNASSDDE